MGASQLGTRFQRDVQTSLRMFVNVMAYTSFLSRTVNKLGNWLNKKAFGVCSLGLLTTTPTIPIILSFDMSAWALVLSEMNRCLYKLCAAASTHVTGKWSVTAPTRSQLCY